MGGDISNKTLLILKRCVGWILFIFINAAFLRISWHVCFTKYLFSPWNYNSGSVCPCCAIPMLFLELINKLKTRHYISPCVLNVLLYSLRLAIHLRSLGRQLSLWMLSYTCMLGRVCMCSASEGEGSLVEVLFSLCESAGLADISQMWMTNWPD